MALGLESDARELLGAGVDPARRVLKAVILDLVFMI